MYQSLTYALCTFQKNSLRIKLPYISKVLYTGSSVHNVFNSTLEKTQVLKEQINILCIWSIIIRAGIQIHLLLLNPVFFILQVKVIYIFKDTMFLSFNSYF